MGVWISEQNGGWLVTGLLEHLWCQNCAFLIRRLKEGRSYENYKIRFIKDFHSDCKLHAYLLHVGILQDPKELFKCDQAILKHDYH